LLLGAAVVLTQLQLARDRVSASTLHAAQIGSCRRVNVLRDTANHIARRQLTLVELVATQRTKEVSVQRHLPGYLAKLYRLRAEATYDPLTDCEQAVDHPLSYVAPRPVPFIRR